MADIQEIMSLVVALIITFFGFFIFLPKLAELLGVSSSFGYIIGIVLFLAVLAALVLTIINIIRR